MPGACILNIRGDFGQKVYANQQHARLIRPAQRMYRAPSPVPGNDAQRAMRLSGQNYAIPVSISPMPTETQKFPVTMS